MVWTTVAPRVTLWLGLALYTRVQGGVNTPETGFCIDGTPNFLTNNPGWTNFAGCFVADYGLPEDEEYVVAWSTVTGEDGVEYAEFFLRRKGSGWMGVAVAEHSSMPGGDFMIVRKEGGEAVVEDRFVASINLLYPEMDESQDVTLRGFWEANNVIEALIRRPVNSCDEKDNPILNVYDELTDSSTGYPHSALWALGSTDVFTKHDARGAFEMNFYSNSPVIGTYDGLPDDVVTEMITFSDHVVGHESTNMYWCLVHELPESLWGDSEEIDLIANRARIQSEFIHHIVPVVCETHPGPDGADIFPCLMVPEDDVCQGKVNVLGWALGLEGVTLPSSVGIRLSKAKKYVVFNTHYYNPDQLADVVDSSGLEYYFTRELRTYNAGRSTLGLVYFELPKGEPNVHIEMRHVCKDPETGDQVWPAQETIVFSVFHHMHTYGRKMSTFVIRDGRRLELLTTKGYSFNDQKATQIRFKLLPGDQLGTECWYDLTDAPENIPYGDYAEEEMCFAFIMFAPPQGNMKFTAVRAMDYSPLDAGACIVRDADTSSQVMHNYGQVMTYDDSENDDECLGGSPWNPAFPVNCKDDVQNTQCIMPDPDAPTETEAPTETDEDSGPEITPVTPSNAPIAGAAWGLAATLF